MIAFFRRPSGLQITDFWICKHTSPSATAEDPTKPWILRRFMPYLGKLRVNCSVTSAIIPELYTPPGQGIVLTTHEPDVEFIIRLCTEVVDGTST